MYTDKQIDAIGLMLEEKGLTHSEIDAYFEHHGKKGMKWGIRKGKAETGVNRAIGAKIDINNRRIYRTKNRINGTGYKASEALGRAFMGGKERQLRLQKAKVNELTKYNSRLKQGKLTTMDVLGTYGTIPIKVLVGGIAAPLVPVRGGTLGLVVTRTPKPLMKPTKTN